jgi:hypothetical protein
MRSSGSSPSTSASTPARRQPRPADRHGGCWSGRRLQISSGDGVNGGIRPTARNVAFMSEQIPGGAEGETSGR